MTRTLVTTAVLFLLCVISPGCDSAAPEPQELRTPILGAVSEIGRSSGGLPVTASIAPRIQLGDPIILRLKITNVLDHKCDDDFDVHSHIPDEIALWLLRDGQQVARTEIGKQMQPMARSVTVIISALPAAKLEPGEVKFMDLDLRDRFKITQPGSYTVVAEAGRIWSNEDSVPEIKSVKAEFVIAPVEQP
jgi:hypothetical protein